MKLPYLQTFTSRGHTFTYYRRNGQRTRIPGDIGTPPWLAEYQRIHATYETPVDRPSRGSVAAVITEFVGSPEFAQLAPVTQRDYRRHLDDIATRCGHLPIADLPRSFVFALRDRYAITPRRANYVVQVLRRLLSFAIDRGYRPDNPALRPKLLRTGPGYRPWRDDEIATFRAHWQPETVERVAFELALATAQRSGDLIRLTRHAYSGGWITLRQRKTGDDVQIPATATLRAVLDPWLASHDSLVILVTRTGRPFTSDHFKHVMGRAYAAAGLDGVTTHGLRHTTATLLAEAGCDWPTIAAVTGHRTAEMVRRYTSKRRRAKAAIERL